MKLLYKAENLAEAHMLQDLLAQQDIPATVQGEYLQAGIGDLPASGLVRIFVPEEKYDTAKEFVSEWVDSQPKYISATEDAPRPVGGYRHLAAGLAGVLLGFSIAYLYFMAPASSGAIDRNGDGAADEFLAFSYGGLVVSSRLDRNSDGKSDEETYFNKLGLVDTSRDDNDFDGNFESNFFYKHGVIDRAESDFDNDGTADQVSYFKNGVVYLTVFSDRRTHTPFRLDKFKDGVFFSSEVDTDRDGKFDFYREYDWSGEVVREAPLSQGDKAGGAYHSLKADAPDGPRL